MYSQRHFRLYLTGKKFALNVFIYSKLWYLAHITPFTKQFKKEIKNHMPVPLGERLISSENRSTIIKTQSGGLGLVLANKHCKKIFINHEIVMFTTHQRSPHADRAANWAVEIGSKKCVAR